jgi:hypothetical protein
MRKLKSFLCSILLLGVYANATAVRGTLLSASAQPLLGGTLELQLSSTDINGNRVVGCAGGSAPVVQGGGVIVTQIVTVRAGTGGVLINTIIGNDQINCGAGFGIGTYYHVIARNAQVGLEWTRDYVIKGGTWTPEQSPLNVLPPAALPITLVINPSGNQIVVQPAGTRFEVQGTMVGNLTGNATTATTAATAAIATSATTAAALAADASNCTSGQFSQGVSETGAAQGCSVPATGSIRISNNFAGGDPGAQVNAADADLGATAGEIWMFGGGAISTQITISSNHTLRIFPGTYTSTVGIANAGTPWSPTFVMSNNSNLRCEGWNTILKESTTLINLPTIVGPKAMFATLGNKTSTATSSNIMIEGCHFQGVGLTPNTFSGTVECGNTVSCKVLNNWFDAVQSIAINVGGGSSTGNFGDNVEIAGNLVTGSIEVEIAVVNGQNVYIHHNTHRDPATTAAGMVDIEPNVSTDRAKNIDIHDNIYDIRGSAGGSDFCVTVQIGTIADATKQGVKVHDNICRGSDPATGGGHLINGITMSGRYVEVYNNTITGAIQGGITALVLDVGSIHDNTVVCSSSLGYNAYEINLQGTVTNVDVYNNKTYNDAGCPGTIPPKKANIAETGASNANNKFWNNVTQGITINGTGSKIITNIDPLGGYSIGANGFGISTPVKGGLSLATLLAPTLQLIRTTAGGSFTAGTYFWKVTAVNAIGETIGSNEITGSPTLNQMAEIQWTASPGASGYKIYRSTTTGTETLCTTISTGQVFYQDPGTACAGAAIPVINTSLGLLATESSAPAGLAGSDLLWPDSTSHCWKFIVNNGSNSGCIPGIAIAQSWTASQTFQAGTGIRIADPSDGTKLAQFDVSNIATSTTRTINVPNANSTTVQSSSAGANQFATGISAQGVLSYAQPTFGNLSGSATLTQGGTTVSTAPDDNILVGNSGSTAFALIALPNCVDTGGNHLNYTTATNLFSCGTTGGIGGGATTALDNLAAVAINTSLLPGTAGTVNLGSGTKPFGEIFLAGTSGTPGTNNFKITGASTSGTRVVTLADGASMTVIADTGAANNFLTAISATGVISKAQPTYTNIGTGTVSGATLDAEAGSNVLKFPRKFSFRFADCDTAGNGVFMGTPGATAPTATCVTGTNIRKGVMNFSAAGTNTLQIHFPLPADFTGTSDLRLFWYSPSTTGAVTWVVEAVCTATSGSTDDPAFSSFWAPSASSPAGTANQIVTVTAATISWPGSCTAGTLAHLNFKRTDTTGAAAANLDSFEITQRRQ